jgi:diguanylate cyclase
MTAAALSAAGGTADRRGAELPPAQLAKAALRRLVTQQLEPTPENYAQAYWHEAGRGTPVPAFAEPARRLIERVAALAIPGAAAGACDDFNDALAQGRWDQAERILEAACAIDAGALAELMSRMLRGVERGGRHWTAARKKDSLQRVLGSTRSDARLLQQRLSQLVSSWEDDKAAADVDFEDPGAEPASVAQALLAPAEAAVCKPVQAESHWGRVVQRLGGSIEVALPPGESISQELAATLTEITGRLAAEGATAPLAGELDQFCTRAEQLLEHRHHMVDQLGSLCRELTASLTDLAENDSWAKGQCDAMRVMLEQGLTVRAVRSVSQLLRHTRERQNEMRLERGRSRDALKSLITRMLSELGDLGAHTGRFHESVGRYADVIENADSLEGLAGVVREMVEESHAVQQLVQQTQQRLQDEHAKATDLTQRVSELEGELRRLSDEVSTDQLTQIANRRGLMLAFEAERARVERAGGSLAVGLLDIDNFKRLNDQLGHGAGDEALKSLAARVSKTLRPTDTVARYGGEEFVVLLPDTPANEGQQILTRLQRSLSGGLFLHEQKQVLVTFSAGVTLYRSAERLEDAIDRADQALYEAKRTGKNRTCIA